MIRLPEWRWARRMRIRYWKRFERYRGWRDIFVRAGWDEKTAKKQAWRQSAWYDPATGRSIEMIESLHGLRKD